MLKRFIIRVWSRVFRTVERCLKGLDNDGQNCWWHTCGLLLICWYIVSGHCRRFQQFRSIQCRLDILQWSVNSKHYIIFKGLPVFKKIIYTWTKKRSSPRTNPCGTPWKIWHSNKFVLWTQCYCCSGLFPSVGFSDLDQSTHCIGPSE